MAFMHTLNTRVVGRTIEQFWIDLSARPKHAGEWRAIGTFDEEGKLVLAALERPEHPVVQIGPQALEGAYWQGWCEASDWAQRDDLYADRDSQAYADAMNRRLGPIRAPAEHPVGSALTDEQIDRILHRTLHQPGEDVPYWREWLRDIGRPCARAVLAATPSRAPAEQRCLMCGGSGRLGGPSFYNPGEGGEPCPECAPAAVSDISEIRGAVARGWCHPKNSAKEMDVDLAEAIAQEVVTLLAAPPAVAPSDSAKPTLMLRALRMADMALASWENGYAFDSHGPSREAQRLVTDALSTLAADSAKPAGETLQSALSKMRHLYANMMRGVVTSTSNIAEGILAPAIEQLEALAAAHTTPVDDKAHPRFLAGYDAGMKDGKAIAIRDAPTPDVAPEAGKPDRVSVPFAWLEELLALCTPEDHELIERVKTSIRPCDSQGAPKPVAWANPVILLPADEGDLDVEWTAKVQGNEDDVFSLPLYLHPSDGAQAAGQGVAKAPEPVAEVIDNDICSDHAGRVEAFQFLPAGTKLYATPEPAAQSADAVDAKRAEKYLRVIRQVRAVVDEWPEVEIDGSPLSRIRSIVAFAGSAALSQSAAAAKEAKST